MRLLYGVGLCDADYKLSVVKEVDGKRKVLWRCPYYRRWHNMLRRCYYGTDSGYDGCKVCDEWLTFSNFKKWMEKQDWEGKHLDKDLIKTGNKVYSPDMCVFVSPKVNSFLVTSQKSKTSLIGCHFEQYTQKYRAVVCNPFSDKAIGLGRFDTELEAHLAWKKRKHELACQLADSEYVTDERVAEALRNRYKDIDQPFKEN